jgi:hypothetical protein
LLNENHENPKHQKPDQLRFLFWSLDIEILDLFGPILRSGGAWDFIVL